MKVQKVVGKKMSGSGGFECIWPYIYLHSYIFRSEHWSNSRFVYVPPCMSLVQGMSHRHVHHTIHPSKYGPLQTVHRIYNAL